MPRSARFAVHALFVGLALVVVTPAAVQAQWTDEPVLARFGLRAGVIPRVETLNRQFGPSGVTSLDLPPTPLDRALLPQLAPVASLLAELTGDASSSLRLGTVRAVRSSTAVVLPFSLEFGATSFLTIGATLPLVRRRIEADVRYSGDGATAGLNPALTGAGGVDAFLSQLGGSLAQARSRVDELCRIDAGGAACASGRSTVTNGEALVQGLGSLYRGSPVVPLPGSPAGTRLLARFDELRTGLAALGAPVTAALPLAGGPMDAAGFASFTTASAFGVGLDPLETVKLQWALGDVEVGARARILSRSTSDSTGMPLSRILLVTGVRVQLPTGQAPIPELPFDPGTSTGLTAVSADVLGDWIRPSWGVRVSGSYTMAGEVTEPRRIAPPEAFLAGSALQGLVVRSGGGAARLEVAPRVALAREFALGAAYTLDWRAEEEYALSVAPSGPGLPLPVPVPDVGLLSEGTGGLAHRGAVFLTLAPVQAFPTGPPVEVFLRYERDLAASGLRGPAGNTLVAGGRIHLLRGR